MSLFPASSGDLYYTEDVTYNGALTNGTGVKLDDTKDYRNAIAITLLTQANVNNYYSGCILYVSNSNGALYMVPSVTSTASVIRVRVLWKKS